MGALALERAPALLCSAAVPCLLLPSGTSGFPPGPGMPTGAYLAELDGPDVERFPAPPLPPPPAMPRAKPSRRTMPSAEAGR